MVPGCHPRLFLRLLVRILRLVPLLLLCSASALSGLSRLLYPAAVEAVSATHPGISPARAWSVVVVCVRGKGVGGAACARIMHGRSRMTGVRGWGGAVVIIFTCVGSVLIVP